jgi:hypothetical protein
VRLRISEAGFQSLERIALSLLLHRRLDRLKLFTRLAPLALRREIPVPPQVIANALQARIACGRNGGGSRLWPGTW